MLVVPHPREAGEEAALCAAAPAQMVCGGRLQCSASGFKSRIPGGFKALTLFLPPSVPPLCPL